MGLDVPSSILTTQMGVPFSCMLGTIFLNDRLGAWRSSGLVVAFLGLMLIAGAPSVSENFTAFLLVLGGAFAWSVSNIIAKRLSDMPIMSTVGWLAIISTPQLLLLSLLFEENHLHILQEATLRPTFGIVYSIVFSTLVAYSLWYHLLNKYKVSQVVPFSLLIPFFGISASVWLLDSPLTWHMLVGGAITMVGVAIIVIRKPRIKQQGEAI
jgi:O-acetylserine/cysteine efflux transporter